MICRDRRLIFVHIPKCGGSSIEDVIWPDRKARTPADLWDGFVRPFYNKHQTGGLQHLTAEFIRQEVGDDFFASAFKFAVVRHPVARIVSQFKFLTRRDDLKRFAGLSDACDFSEYLEKTGKTPHVQWTPQVDFVLDRHGEMAMDRIYKLEDLANDAGALRRDLGFDFEMPHANATVGVPEPVLTNADRDRIHQRYRRDFELFGYTM